jgi:hypothetical protein
MKNRTAARKVACGKLIQEVRADAVNLTCLLDAP